MVALTITSSAQLTSTRPVMSAEAFDAWVETQTDDAIYELIAGEVVQVPTNTLASFVTAKILSKIETFADESDMGWVTAPDGGFLINGERYAPDVAFVSFKTQESPSETGYNPFPPDIAVEVLSTDSASELEKLQLKLANYMLAGTILLVVNPYKETVQLHIPGQPPQNGDRNTVITFKDLLPGFELNMTEIFDKIKKIRAGRKG